MAEEVVETLKKSDTDWLEIGVRRTSKGITLRAKSDPRFEEFMKGLAEGSLDRLSVFGRTWYTPTGADLGVYRLVHIPDSSPYYTLDAVCAGLTVLEREKDYDEKLEKINLSFLRFQGISVGTGVSFNIDGPFSRDLVRTFASRAKDATAHLIRSYLVPITVNLRISSQEF